MNMIEFLVKSPALWATFIPETITNNPYLYHFQAMDVKNFNYLRRKAMVKKFSWAVPNENAFSTIKKYSPDGVVEIGAGSGYWAWLLRNRGVTVYAFDIAPGKNCYTNYQWCDMAIGGVEQALYYKNQTLMLCWPPYSEAMAADCLKNYSGSTVIYIGEGAGGCTADDEFHSMLDKWKLVKTVEIPQWWGIHDELFVYQR